MHPRTPKSNWKLHWLEAEGDLSPWRRRIVSGVKAARRAIAAVVPPPPLDILVQRLAGGVIPEIGMVGHAYRKGLTGLTLDPDNRHFATCLRDGLASTGEPDVATLVNVPAHTRASRQVERREKADPPADVRPAREASARGLRPRQCTRSAGGIRKKPGKQGLSA